MAYWNYSDEGFSEDGLFIASCFRQVKKVVPQRRHHHPYYELLCISEGSTHVVIQDKTYVASAGDLLIYYPFVDHEETVQPGRFAYTWLRFGMGQDEVRDFFPSLEVTEPLIHLPWPERFQSLFSQMIIEQQMCDRWSHMMASGYLAQFIGLLQRSLHLLKVSAMSSGEDSSTRITKAVQIMHNSLESDISLKDLASECCMSESHFSHRFKEILGCSPKQYLIHAKVMKARELLETTDLPIGEIAAQVGYDNARYFRKVFRKVTSLSPTSYRKNCRI